MQCVLNFTGVICVLRQIRKQIIDDTVCLYSAGTVVSRGEAFVSVE